VMGDSELAVNKLDEVHAMSNALNIWPLSALKHFIIRYVMNIQVEYSGYCRHAL